MRVTVRFFAAARAAAGAEEEVVKLPAGATVADLIALLEARGETLSRVLARCSYLCDGVAVRDTATALGDAQTLDVLPPFAGG
nr:MoaD/ThiS family protein [Mycolicibacterium chubuense]